jgi:hypothetical protein
LFVANHPYVAELKRVSHLEIIDLPTGHWPQFTRPSELAAVMIDVLARAAAEKPE